MAVTAQAEAITAGVVSTNMPKGESSIRRGQGVLLLLLRPIVSKDRAGATVDDGGGEQAEVKSAPLPVLGRFQQHGAKGETAVVIFIVFVIGICGDGKG